MKNAYVNRVWEEVKAKNANEPEFLQAVEEVLTTLDPVVDNYTRKTNSKEIFTYRVFRVYELCYKGVCRQTTSRELKSQINCCLRHDGGSACLNKVIE